MDYSRFKVTISANGVPDVIAFMDETPVQVVSGYGGWQVVSRERRIGLTQWQGKDPLRMSVPLLFDGVRSGQGQELAISHLSRMALPPQGGGEPPVVTISGRGVPSPGPTQWVIENLQWGSNVMWDFDDSGVMSRVRQDVVVNLLEYRGDDRVAFRALQPGLKPGKSTSGWPKTYTVKSGDTLQKIAAHFYKNASKWKQIATANNIRDPKKLKVNSTIRIPAP